MFLHGQHNKVRQKDMKHTIRLMTFLAATATLMAQSPEPQDKPPGDHPKPPPPPLMAALDTDKDGEISAEEIENAADSLAKADTNGDGKISKEEVFVKPPMPPEHREEPRDKEEPMGKRPPPPVIDVLDEDQDGKLSAKEIRDADKALLTLDHNGDRELTEEEMFGPPPPNGPNQGGQGDNRPQRPMPPPGPPRGGGGPRR